MEKDQKIYGIFNHIKPKNIYSEWDNHGEITISLVKRDEAGKIRNFSDFEDQDLSLFFPDIQLRTFYTVKNHEVSEFYGWSIEYKPHAVDLPKAEKMVKTLKLINRRLEKIAAQWGPARYFGEYALRFLKATGAAGLLKLVSSRPGGWSYDDSEYRAVALPGVPALVSNERTDYEDEVEKRKAAV